MSQGSVSEKPRCSELNRRGEPCGAAPVRGRGKCAGHLGLGKLDAVVANERSLVVRREKAARRRMGLIDHLAEKLDAKAERLAEVWTDLGMEDWRATEGF